MTTLRYVPADEFCRVVESAAPALRRAAAFAAASRVNVYYMVKRAGSGHLGTSFSCLDIVTWLFLQEMKLDEDLYFSSKGHDVPALYSTLAGLGLLDFEMIHKLRRLGGLPGHPEVEIPRMEANTGSLGMGISKAKGFAWAKRLQKLRGRVFVTTGDGELNEGQIWESLPSAVGAKMGEITVIVDHNKIQSDTWCRRVSDPGDLEAKWRSFGWHVARTDGHDFEALGRTFAALRGVTDRPKVVIADTVKGKGVSFMERFGPDGNYYAFHSGAPTDEQYAQGLAELLDAANRAFAAAGLGEVRTKTYDLVVTHSPLPRHKLVEAYSRAILREAERNPRIVALDADLIKDCGLPAFAEKLPGRLIECGIAEQDMVATAGGLALKGMLPVCHSFAAFLSARPNEQIYTNATERTKVIYVATLAGLLPGTPGHSHQAVRDISTLAAVPRLILLAPSTEPETEAAVEFAVHGTEESVYLRLSSIPCIIPFTPPRDRLEMGKGAVLHEGGDAVIFAYGPVMTAQAYTAAEKLRAQGVALRVLNLPWLNRVDIAWLRSVAAGVSWVFTLDDHYVAGGQGEMILSRLAESGWPAGVRAKRFGVAEVPVCGQNDEVLRHHRLDADCLAEDILGTMRGRP